MGIYVLFENALHETSLPLPAGLDKCCRSAAHSRILLASYLLSTHPSSVQASTLQAILPCLVTYLQRQVREHRHMHITPPCTLCRFGYARHESCIFGGWCAGVDPCLAHAHVDMYACCMQHFSTTLDELSLLGQHVGHTLTRLYETASRMQARPGLQRTDRGLAPHPRRNRLGSLGMRTRCCMQGAIPGALPPACTIPSRCTRPLCLRCM